MTRLPENDQWLDLEYLIRVKRLTDDTVIVWPLGSDPTNNNGGLRLDGADARAILEDIDAYSDLEDEAAPVPGIEAVNGIGPKYASALEAAGIATLEDLAAASLEDADAAAVAADLAKIGDEVFAAWQAQVPALLADA